MHSLRLMYQHFSGHMTTQLFFLSFICKKKTQKNGASMLLLKLILGIHTYI